MLTANTTVLGGSGTITYRWKRDTTDIGTNSSNYTVQSADIGATITVTVTRSGYSGSVTSTPTAAVTHFTERRSLTIDMYDSAGDGWDGNGALRIRVNGIDIASNVKVTQGYSNTYTFDSAIGAIVQLYWVEGTYQQENSFIVYYTDTPPSPVFTTSTYGTNSWNGENALVYRVYGTGSNTLYSVAGGTLLGSFTVE
jgi:hypothetical protein